MANTSTARGRDTQNLIIFLCWCVYSSAYFGRYSFSASINPIIRDYGVSNAETGLISTCFFIAYGVGQVVNGFLCKKYPAKFTFPLALGSSSLINIAVFITMKTGFLHSHFHILKYVWLLNGAVQSVIWTSIIFILGKNIEQKNVAKSALAIGTTVPAGTFLAYSIATLMAHFNIYEWSFLLAAITMGAVAAAWLVFFKPHERTDIKEEEKETAATGKGRFTYAAFITIAGLSLFAVSNNFIKDGLQNWIPTILKTTYRFTEANALLISTSIYLLGIAGSFLVKKINKSVKDHIVLSVLFFGVIAVFIALIAAFLNVSAIPVVLFFAVVMICTYGVNNIVTSVAPLSLRGVMNPGFAAGLLDGFCYIGSALSTYILGLVADKYDGKWDVPIVLLLIIAGFAIIAASALRLATRKKV